MRGEKKRKQCYIRYKRKSEEKVVVKKQWEIEEVAERFKRIPKVAGICREFGGVFWKWEHCPDVLCGSSICSINYNSPPPSTPPYSTTCFLSMASLYVSKIQESTFSTRADAITYNQHPPPTSPSYYPPAHAHTHTHTDTHQHQQSPAGILMSYLLGSESEKASK